MEDGVEEYICLGYEALKVYICLVMVLSVCSRSEFPTEQTNILLHVAANGYYVYESVRLEMIPIPLAPVSFLYSSLVVYSCRRGRCHDCFC